MATNPEEAIRQWVEEALTRVIAGEMLTTAELDAALHRAGDRIGSRVVGRAWHELYHWVTDEDIRRKDPPYGEAKRKQLNELLATIKAMPAGR